MGKQRTKKQMDKKRVKLFVTFGVLLAVLAGLVLYLTSLGETATVGATAEFIGKKFVIDPGHGGFDVGTSGTNTKVEEDDLNLEIAIRLRDALLKSGAEVVMTRSDGDAIATSKQEDMAKRREIIETSGQDLTISIHQNFYEDPDVCGPQVFDAPGSVEGEKLARCIQERLNKDLEVKKPLSHKEGNYYIVKSGAAPAVIVECGFLSNPEEEILLGKKFYQIKIVKAIMEGMEDYLAEAKTNA